MGASRSVAREKGDADEERLPVRVRGSVGLAARERLCYSRGCRDTHVSARTDGIGNRATAGAAAIADSGRHGDTGQDAANGNSGWPARDGDPAPAHSLGDAFIFAERFTHARAAIGVAVAGPHAGHLDCTNHAQPGDHAR